MCTYKLMDRSFVTIIKLAMTSVWTYNLLRDAFLRDATEMDCEMLQEMIDHLACMLETCICCYSYHFCMIQERMYTLPRPCIPNLHRVICRTGVNSKKIHQTYSLAVKIIFNTLYETPWFERGIKSL